MTGSGTQQDPYIIANYEDLCNLTETTAYYRLDSDIDFAQIDRDSKQGAITVKFKELDGNGHTISNFFGRQDSATGYNAVFRFGGSSSANIRNLYFKGIYLAGGITCFFDMSQTANSVYIYNCKIAVKINDVQNSVQAPFFNKIFLNDSEILLEGTSDRTKQITSYATNGCLIRLNLTFFNINYTTTALIFGGGLTLCGITGHIVCKTENGARYTLTSGLTSNSYFALYFNTAVSCSMNGGFAGVNFYDKEVMKNIVSYLPTQSNFYALTTEQCKNAEYLQSINFPCTSG